MCIPQNPISYHTCALDIQSLKDYKEMRPIISSIKQNPISVDTLLHYGTLNFNNQNYDCLLFNNLFVMCHVFSNNKMVSLRPSIFNSQTIYPVMKVGNNSGFEVLAELPETTDTGQHQIDNNKSGSKNHLTTKSSTKSSKSVDAVQAAYRTNSADTRPAIVKQAVKYTSSLNPSGKYHQKARINQNRPLSHFEFLLKCNEPKQELRFRCNLFHEKGSWIEAFKKVSIAENCSRNAPLVDRPNSLKSHTPTQYTKTTYDSGKAPSHISQNYINCESFEENNLEDDFNEMDLAPSKLGYQSSVKSTITLGEFDSLGCVGGNREELEFDIDGIMRKYE